MNSLDNFRCKYIVQSIATGLITYINHCQDDTVKSTTTPVNPVTHIATTGATAQRKMKGIMNPNCFAPEVSAGHIKAQAVPVASQEYNPYPKSGGIANNTALNQHTPMNTP